MWIGIFPPVSPYTEQYLAGPSTGQYFGHHDCVRNEDAYRTKYDLINNKVF